jgi:drug/metabolite transporter (DMT)-like permease
MQSIYLQTTISLFLFSLVAIGIKMVNANPFTIGGVRLFIATIGFYFFIKNKSELFKILKAKWKILFTIGIVFAFHWITYFYSIKLSGASLGFVALSTYGIQILILGSIFLKHSFTKLQFLGVLVSFTGTLFVVPSYNFQDQATIGFLIGVFSGLLYALMPILNQLNSDIPPKIRVFSQFLFAFIVFSFFTPLMDWNFSYNDWGILFLLGTLGTLVAHTLWANITSKIPTSATGVIYYLNVPLTIYWGHLILDEQLISRQLLGTVLIICGSLLNIIKTK